MSQPVYTYIICLLNQKITISKNFQFLNYGTLNGMEMNVKKKNRINTYHFFFDGKIYGFFLIEFLFQLHCELFRIEINKKKKSNE